jgi:hypothetical protein
MDFTKTLANTTEVQPSNSIPVQQQSNPAAIPSPSSYAPISGLDKLLAGAMRLNDGGGGDESISSTWDGSNSLNQTVDSAFQKAMNGQGDYAFVCFNYFLILAFSTQFFLLILGLNSSNFFLLILALNSHPIFFILPLNFSAP